MQQHISGRIITEKSLDSQCKRCRMDRVWTCQQTWIHCTTVSTNTRIWKSTQQTPEQKKLEQLKERLSKERNSQKFNLEIENFSPEVTVKHFCTSFKKEQIWCKMNQIPANSNDGTTGHKLQGI